MSGTGASAALQHERQCRMIDGIEVEIPSGWAVAAPSDDRSVRETRELLGIEGWSGVATGHQPGFWHGGILAKAVVASEMSAWRGHGWMHLVADHDACEPDAVAYPAVRGTGREPAGPEPAVRAALARFTVPPAPGTAACSIAAAPPRTIERACPLPAATDAIGARLSAVHDALARADASHGAAWRAVHANFSLLESRGALRPPSRIASATALLGTPLGLACARAIAGDPAACARAFNAALDGLPRVANPLRIDGDRSEVPLWRLGANGVRQRLDGLQLRQALRDGALEVGVLHSGPMREGALLPRAFLATGMVRALGVPFVHGTGGRIYERAGDAWWRGLFGRTLPPFAVATASLRFTPAALGVAAHTDGGVGDGRLAWRDAWVDPARLDGVREDAGRAELRAHMDTLPRRSTARKAAYQLMRARVGVLREQRKAELDALALRDAHDRDAIASRAAAADRTYAAAIHDAAALAELATSVVAAASAASPASPASGSRR